MALDVRTKRVYESADPEDGYRVLIDHVWPRGVSQERAQLDEWAQELAPSDELRKWFDHVPERFEEFRARYRRELSGHGELLNKLRERAAAREPAVADRIAHPPAAPIPPAARAPDNENDDQPSLPWYRLSQPTTHTLHRSSTHSLDRRLLPHRKPSPARQGSYPAAFNENAQGPEPLPGGGPASPQAKSDRVNRRAPPSPASLDATAQVIDIEAQQREHRDRSPHRIVPSPQATQRRRYEISRQRNRPTLTRPLPVLVPPFDTARQSRADRTGA